MCTAVTYRTNDAYFGRTLDYEHTYGEQIVITPRQFSLPFLHTGTLHRHYAIIGMAHVAGGYPLYYDAVNEKGLAMAGLNFVGNAVYHPAAPEKDNVAQFELISWLLSRCASVREAKDHLSRLRITGDNFSPALPPAQLHWLLADREQAVTVESVAAGLQVLDNPVGVLTNNPPFPTQLFHLNNFAHVSASEPENRFSPKLALEHYSRGLGGLGLPGDLSSQSRFVRAAFTKLNARCGSGELESVGQVFHILGTVEQVRGCCRVEDGSYEFTQYTSCCNLDRGIYYYTTRCNHRITAVHLHSEDLESRTLIPYDLQRQESVFLQNQRQNAAGE